MKAGDELASLSSVTKGGQISQILGSVLNLFIGMATKYTDPVIIPADTDETKKQCIDVRIKVFVDEQGYPLETETDDYDPDCWHWLATCIGPDGKRVPVGTVRLYPYSEGVGKLGRLAVLSDARGLKLGKKLVQVLVESAKKRGMTAIMCEAQVDKRVFYEKLGFVIEKGDEEPYPVDGTPHLKMWKRSL